MFKKAILLSCLLVLVVFRVPAMAAAAVDSHTFAHAWNSYSDGEKKSFLFGLATAVRIVCTDLSTMHKDAKTEDIEKNFRGCFNNYAGMEPGQVIAAMNSLYADPKNAMIPLDGVYKIALMQIHGDKVDEVIAQSRKYGERLKKEIEEQRGKPGK